MLLLNIDSIGLMNEGVMKSIMQTEDTNTPKVIDVDHDGRKYSINVTSTHKFFRDYSSHGRILLYDPSDLAAFDAIAKVAYSAKVDKLVYNDRPLYMVRIDDTYLSKCSNEKLDISLTWFWRRVCVLDMCVGFERHR
jgi:hypothetical protein